MVTCRADGRVSGERNLGNGSEDIDRHILAGLVGIAVVEEHRFRQVELLCNGLLLRLC